MKIRTQVKAGGGYLNHNEALRILSAIKAGTPSIPIPPPMR